MIVDPIARLHDHMRDLAGLIDWSCDRWLQGRPDDELLWLARALNQMDTTPRRALSYSTPAPIHYTPRRAA